MFSVASSQFFDDKEDQTFTTDSTELVKFDQTHPYLDSLHVKYLTRRSHSRSMSTLSEYLCKAVCAMAISGVVILNADALLPEVVDWLSSNDQFCRDELFSLELNIKAKGKMHQTLDYRRTPRRDGLCVLRAESQSFLRSESFMAGRLEEASYLSLTEDNTTVGSIISDLEEACQFWEQYYPEAASRPDTISKYRLIIDYFRAHPTAAFSPRELWLSNFDYGYFKYYLRHARSRIIPGEMSSAGVGNLWIEGAPGTLFLFKSFSSKLPSSGASKYDSRRMGSSIEQLYAALRHDISYSICEGHSFPIGLPVVEQPRIKAALKVLLSALLSDVVRHVDAWGMYRRANDMLLNSFRPVLLIIAEVDYVAQDDVIDGDDDNHEEDVVRELPVESILGKRSAH